MLNIEIPDHHDNQNHIIKQIYQSNILRTIDFTPRHIHLTTSFE